MKRAWSAVIAGAALAAFAASTPAARAADSLNGAGDSWPTPAVAKLQNDSTAEVAPFEQSYVDAGGESEARDNLASKDDDYAVTSAPLTAAQKKTASDNGRTIAYAPFMAGAVAPVVALDVAGAGGGTRVEHLKLTVATMAKLFTHQITQWNSPEILAENDAQTQTELQNLKQPDVQFVVLATPSPSTAAIVSLFLSDPDAAKTWNTYATNQHAQPGVVLDTWPTDGDSHAHRISSGSKGVIDFTLSLDAHGCKFQSAASHYITYLAPAWTKETCTDQTSPDFNKTDSAPAATLLSADKKTSADPTPAAVTRAVADGKVDPATNIVQLSYGFSTSDPAAYPITLVSYLAVPTSGLDPAKAGALSKFVKFAVGDTGQKDVTDVGYVGVPNELKAASLKVADTLAGQSAATTTTAPAVAANASGGAAGGGLGGGSASGGGGTDVSGNSTGGGSGNAASLANTGRGPSWPLVGGAGALLAGGEAVRRRTRRHLHSEFTK